MASRIEPDAVARPNPAAKPAPPAAKPAAAPPAAAKPAGPPPAAAKPAAEPSAGASHDAAHHDEPVRRRGGAGFLRHTPAWAVSMLVHVIAILGLALIYTPAPIKEAMRVIVSSTADVEEDAPDLTPQPEDQIDKPEKTEVTEVLVPTDVTVVEDVKVVSTANDLDAAPVAVELVDIGASSANTADLLSTVGAPGGKGLSGIGGRSNAAKIAAAEGGGPDTEAAVDRALKWLIAHQMPDGGWNFDLQKCPSCAGKCSHGGEKRGPDRGGATALALLPFLGRGHTHIDGPYKQQIEQGLAFLVNMTMKGKGQAYGPGGSLYSQGLAGIALAESYAMTQDQRLAQPTQLALNFIMDAQDPRGGGWRYQPKQPGDTSVVGWQLMALKSGAMSYLEVNPLTIKKASDFLDSVQDDSGVWYGYTDSTSAKGRPGTTAVGLLCRMYLGWKKDHPALQEGVTRLAKLGPSNDLYFDYYATQVMHHMEGDVWLAWNAKMKQALLSTQSTKGHEAGSWFEGFDKGHGPHIGGRLYTTALATMILEVYYRHLPIYRNETVDTEFKE
jgi:hypothetical protein